MQLHVQAVNVQDSLCCFYLLPFVKVGKASSIGCFLCRSAVLQVLYVPGSTCGCDILLCCRLAASEDVVGVTLGGIVGHAICTGAAVMGGRHLATHINEKAVAVSVGRSISNKH